jgi:hypothetical protein
MERFAPNPRRNNHGECARAHGGTGTGSAFRPRRLHAQRYSWFAFVPISPGSAVGRLVDWRQRGKLLRASLARLALVTLLLFAAALPTHSVGFPALGTAEPVPDPIQGSVEGVTSWRAGEYRIEPLASYDITARVLGVKWYPEGTDRFADVSSVDLALGWGRMADRELLQRLNVRQDDRWYFVKWRSVPISAKEVIASSANTHILPASPEVAAKLANVKAGDMVHLKGYLVDTVGGDGWRWASSVARDDTGGGSCEALWVEEVEVQPDDVLAYATVH